jgi:PAS domain S-box-containing protein
MLSRNQPDTEASAPSAHHLTDQAQRRLIAVIENTTDFIGMALPDGTIIYVNRAGRRLVGLGENDLLAGRQLQDFHPPEAGARLRHEALPAAQRGGTWSGESTLLASDGRSIPVSQVLIAHFDDIGKVSHFSTIIRDLSAQKQAEAALIASWAQLNQAQRIARLGSWELSLPSLRLTWSEEIYRICETDPTKFAVSYEAFLGFVHPDDRRKVDQAYAHAVKSRLPYEITHRLLLPDGRIKWVHEHGETAYGPTGEPLRTVGTMQDITARIQTMEALRESRMRLEEIIHSLDVVVWEADARTFQITFISERVERLLGYPRRQWLEEPEFWRKHLHPEDRDTAIAFSSAAAQQMKDHRFEYRLLAASGRVVWVKDIVTVLSEDGRPAKLRGIMMDITEQKYAEHALRQSHETLDRLFNTVHFCAVCLDRDFNFIQVNRAYAEACARPVDFFPGKNHFALYPQADNEAIFREVVQTGRPFTALAKPFCFPDHPEWGVTYWDWTLHPVKNPAGQVEGLLFILLDVTKRKLAEDTLRESEARYRLLFENNPQPMWAYDTVTQRFLTVNEAAIAHYGYTREEFLALTIDRLRPPGEPAANGKNSPSGPPGRTTGEWRHRLKDGRLISVEILAHSLTLDGRPAMLELVTDITEKKKLQEQLLRAQRLENLGLLAAGIAHDLNNVLSPVLMGATLLRLRAANPADVPILDTLEKSATRGANLVRQILSFARGTGEGALVQPRHLLRDLAELIEETFPKSIRFEADLPKDLWVIHGSPTHFHQILLNLCVNARDAMSRGGSLRLRAANQHLDAMPATAPAAARPGPYVVIEVTDTGTGIPPEALEHIWEPFYTTKGDKGTGLGLSTVRGIVHDHGGFITLDTRVDHGSTFRVYLPAAETPVETTAPAAPHAPTLPAGRGELVLVVDDEPHIRNLTAEILSQRGYRVLTAAHGTEALTLFTPRATEIALVISDVRMPELDGPALAHALPRFNPAVKILFITGAASVREGGASLPPHRPLLGKPFTPDELLIMVDRILHGATPAAPGER